MTFFFLQEEEKQKYGNFCAANVGTLSEVSEEKVLLEKEEKLKSTLFGRCA